MRILGTATAAIAGASILLTMTLGVRQSFGLFLVPVEEGLMISRDTFSFAIALQNILWGFLSPYFGGLADRHGAAKVAFAGALLYLGGMVVMAMAGDGAMVSLGQGLIGTGIAGAGFSVALGAVAKVVAPQKRTMALGLVTAAGSFGQFAMIPLAQELIAALGWRGALYGMAAIAAIMLPAATLLRSDEKSLAGTSHAQPVIARFALKNRSYVMLTVGFFVCGFQIVFIATHLPAYLADIGQGPEIAAIALALIGLFNIIGTLFCGWIGDRKSKKNSLFWMYLLRSAVITGFIVLPVSVFSTYSFAIMIGLLWLGTVPLTSGLVSVFFGARHMSLLYGIVFLSHQLGSATGAWLSGHLYEATGSYEAAWWIAIILGIAAALVHYPIAEKSDEGFHLRFDAKGQQA